VARLLQLCKNKQHFGIYADKNKWFHVFCIKCSNGCNWFDMICVAQKVNIPISSIRKEDMINNGIFKMDTLSNKYLFYDIIKKVNIF
jgi:hypothetical protein